MPGNEMINIVIESLENSRRVKWRVGSLNDWTRLANTMSSKISDAVKYLRIVSNKMSEQEELIISLQSKIKKQDITIYQLIQQMATHNSSMENYKQIVYIVYKDNKRIGVYSNYINAVASLKDILPDSTIQVMESRDSFCPMKYLESFCVSYSGNDYTIIADDYYLTLNGEYTV